MFSKDASLGGTIHLHNVGTKSQNKVEFKLLTLRAYHHEKGAWREQQRAEFEFGRTVDLQPDDRTEGFWLASLSHTAKIELTLPEGTYLPNPEKRAQIFEAKFQIISDKGGRMETLCFSWEPGQIPRVLDYDEVHDLKHGS